MKRQSSLGFTLLLIVLLLGFGFASFWQWQQTMTLRSELKLAELDVSELASVRAENRRLREKQIPPQELAKLRADHAALPRLRAELESLTKKTPVPAP